MCKIVGTMQGKKGRTIATQATVHVACVVTALKAIEIATNPDPDKKIMNNG
jgi:hypothetical protein